MVAGRVMRNAYIRSLERRGVDFGAARRYWSSKRPALEACRREVERRDMTYPEYFTSDIHTYYQGHLSWEQAYHTGCHMQGAALLALPEIDPALASRGEPVTPAEAYGAYKRHVAELVVGGAGPGVRRLLDVGCGTGSVTSLLSARFEEVTGVDLSPPYLAIARHCHPTLRWIHANAEATGLPGDGQAFDAVSMVFMLHEMVPEAIANALGEAYRLLPAGGRLVVLDMDPARLPAYPSFIDISEPHLEAYRAVDLRQAMSEVGFGRVTLEPAHGMTALFVATK